MRYDAASTASGGVSSASGLILYQSRCGEGRDRLRCSRGKPALLSGPDAEMTIRMVEHTGSGALLCGWDPLSLPQRHGGIDLRSVCE